MAAGAGQPSFGLPGEHLNQTLPHPRLALLIDAENVSHHLAPILFKEVRRFGTPEVLRVYGDFKGPAAGWAEAAARFALESRHCGGKASHRSRRPTRRPRLHSAWGHLGPIGALGGVKAGDRVLVSGALGAVGRVAVQYLKELGARPVAGVRGERLDEGKALAGDAVDIDQVPSAPTFDYAISAAGPVAGNVIRHVRDGGTMSSSVQVPEGANEGARIKIVGIFAHDDAAMLQQVADAAGRGDLTIPVAQTFPLEQLGYAHRALAAGARGKILLRH